MENFLQKRIFCVANHILGCSSVRKCEIEMENCGEYSVKFEYIIEEHWDSGSKNSELRVARGHQLQERREFSCSFERISAQIFSRKSLCCY